MRKEKPGCILNRNLVFVVCPIWAAAKKPATGQKLTENSKTDEQKSYSRPYRDGRECCSIQSPVLFELLAVAALVMTNFLSNVVTMVLFFNIGLALLSGSNMHMGAFAAVIGVAASMASLTPSACTPAPLIFGPGHVTVRGVLKANLVFLVMSLAACLVVVYPLASAVFG